MGSFVTKNLLLKLKPKLKPAKTPEPSIDECSIGLPDVTDYTANNNVVSNRRSDDQNPFALFIDSFCIFLFLDQLFLSCWYYVLYQPADFLNLRMTRICRFLWDQPLTSMRDNETCFDWLINLDVKLDWLEGSSNFLFHFSEPCFEKKWFWVSCFFLVFMAAYMRRGVQRSRFEEFVLRINFE